MDSALFIAGGLAVLLLFGCVGGKMAEKQPLPPKPPMQPAGTVGDKDIATAESGDDDILAGDDLLPPEPAAQLDDADITVEEIDDIDLISEENFVEPV